MHFAALAWRRQDALAILKRGQFPSADPPFTLTPKTVDEDDEVYIVSRRDHERDSGREERSMKDKPSEAD